MTRHTDDRRGRAIHPFPARMAPEIALDALSAFGEDATVMDPMCGSGTVLREALRQRQRAIGFDLDPLAVLIARVSTQPLDTAKFVDTAGLIADKASSLRGQDVPLPWIDNDDETRAFVDFWFAREQQADLRAIAAQVNRRHGPQGAALKLALSRLIITKEPRASLARDTSHSRPHRVLDSSDYDVLQGFRQSAVHIARELDREPFPGKAEVRRADARRLGSHRRESVDAVVTSPPYGSAIDYLRGHRLALVWLGYSLSELKALRSRVLGYHAAGDQTRGASGALALLHIFGPVAQLEPSALRRLRRYGQDLWLVLKQVHRVLKPGGRAVLVVGNSNVKGVFLDNTAFIAAAAERIGLRQTARYARQIPANHRYLPPPTAQAVSSLDKRMKEEVVLTFKKD